MLQDHGAIFFDGMLPMLTLFISHLPYFLTLRILLNSVSELKLTVVNWSEWDVDEVNYEGLRNFDAVCLQWMGDLVWSHRSKWLKFFLIAAWVRDQECFCLNQKAYCRLIARFRDSSNLSRDANLSRDSSNLPRDARCEWWSCKRRAVF